MTTTKPTEDLHGRRPTAAHLGTTLQVGADEIEVWRVQYDDKLGKHSTARFRLNGSPWLTLNELCDAYDVEGSENAVLDAYEDWLYGTDNPERL